MQLTSQQLAEVVAAMRDKAPKSKDASNKRRFTRLEVQTKIEIVAASPDIMPRRFSGLARDISFGGVRILQSVPVVAGHEIVVSLPNGRGGTYLIRCAVVHVADLAHGIFEVGTQFIAEMGIEFLERLAAVGDDEMARIRQSILDGPAAKRRMRDEG